MPTATMTSKGQITIPKEVRKELGLKPGVQIAFYQLRPGQVMLRAKTGSIMDLEGCIPSGDRPMSIEEMHQILLDTAAELDDATRSDAQGSVSRGEAA